MWFGKLMSLNLTLIVFEKKIRGPTYLKVGYKDEMIVNVKDTE